MIRRVTLLVVLIGIFLASSLSVAQGGLSQGDPLLPPLTNLRDWAGKAFYSATSTEHFTLVALAPGGSPGWIAYGVDVTTGDIAFQIALGNNAELQQFSAQLTTQEVGQSVLAPGNADRFGRLFQLTIPPPVAPNGANAIDWLADRLFRLGFQSIQSDKRFSQ